MKNDFEKRLFEVLLSGVKSVVSEYKDDLEFSEMETSIPKVCKALGDNYYIYLNRNYYCS